MSSAQISVLPLTWMETTWPAWPALMVLGREEGGWSPDGPADALQQELRLMLS